MVSVEDRMIKILGEYNIGYELTEHEPVYTSEQAANVRKGATPADGVKSLLFKCSWPNQETSFVLILQRGDLRVDTKKLKALVGTKKMALASTEEVKEKCGVEIGAVGPFGHPKPIPTYMSESILEKEWIFTQAGNHRKTIHMKSKDLKEIVKPVALF